jgi:serine/threonine-protein kinase RsbW
MSMDKTAAQIGVDVGTGKQPVSLVIPCKAEFIGLCRLVAGVLGGRESLSEEDVADLKVVVTEACTCFIWGPDGPPLADEVVAPPDSPSRLRVDFNVLPRAWEIVISDPDGGYRLPPTTPCDPAGGAGLGMTILKALVESIERTDNDGEGSVLRLMKRLPDAGAGAD